MNFGLFWPSRTSTHVKGGGREPLLECASLIFLNAHMRGMAFTAVHGMTRFIHRLASCAPVCVLKHIMFIPSNPIFCFGGSQDFL